MATPTWAENATQLKNLVKPHTDLEAHFSTQVTDYDTAEQSAEGDFMPARVVTGLGRMRARVSAAIGWEEHKGDWDAWVLEGLRVAGQPNEDAYGRIHRYMHEQSYTFNDRGWTRGTPSAGGGNVGTGTLKRLTVDWEAYNLQGGHVETKTFECIVDANNGVFAGAEQFRIAGEDASKDNLDYQGSGAYRARLQAQHSGSGAGGSQLQNSSFDATFGTESTTKIPGWTITTGTTTNITQSTAATFRTAPGAGTSYALVFAAQAGVLEITQALSVKRISAQGERTPWMMCVAYKKSSAASTGTMRLKIGSKTTSLDLSTIGDTSWHQLFFTIDKNVYYRNWQENAPDVEIEIEDGNGGTVTIDDCCFNTWTFADGTYWWLTGGATAFLNRDVFTAADSGPTAAGSECMYAAARAGVLPMGERPFAIVNLPSNNGGAETITDP